MNGFRRGALIVIEGVDRSGKSTQCRKLVESLKAKNIEANLVTFPDRTTQIGAVIDKYLKQEINLCDEAIHLLFTANRWERKNQMEALLTQGVTLIVDRYSYSGIVYSSVKKGMNQKWCQEPEKGLLKPDLVCLLTLEESELAKRPEYGNERYETKQMQEKVARTYMDLSQTSDNRWEIIPAVGSIEDVHSVLLDKIIRTICEVGGQPLLPLTFEPQTENVFSHKTN